MNDVRDLTRASKDFSRGLSARAPEDLTPFRVTDSPPSLRRPLAWLFLAIVVAPALVRFLFLLLFISPQYESTTLFVVRGDVDRGGTVQGLGGRLGALASITTIGKSQETSILARLIPDRAFVDRLIEKIDLASFYTREDVDSFSRLAPSPSRSALTGYWQGMSSLAIDPLSGAATLKVRAFAPDDARRINETALKVSEEALNVMLDSSRRDALRIAEQDKARASEELEALRKEIEAFRRQNGVIDPETAGSSALSLILDRRSKRAALAAELQAALASLSPRSAQVRSLEARIAALDQQIAELEEVLSKGEGNKPIADLISTYEELDIRRGFAEQTYTIAELTLLRTKSEVERWHVYVIPVTPPDTPISSVEPKPFSEAGHLMLVGFIIWGVVSLLALGTAEHRQ